MNREPKPHETQPPGLSLNGLTGKETVARALALGVKRGKSDSFGTHAPGHGEIPIYKPGDSIVDAAGGLEARRAGKISLSYGVVTKPGKALLERARSSREENTNP